MAVFVVVVDKVIVVNVRFSGNTHSILATM